jgi:hypothetical protein
VTLKRAEIKTQSGSVSCSLESVYVMLHADEMCMPQGFTPARPAPSHPSRRVGNIRRIELTGSEADQSLEERHTEGAGTELERALKKRQN